MDPAEIVEAREDMRAAHVVYLTAIQAYAGAVVRGADPAVTHALRTTCLFAADAYDATLLVLIDLVAALPPTPKQAAELKSLTRLKRQLADGHRLLR